ncbi:FAD/NAD(P)-binding protein [Microbulbifer yueqingensis]|uniref:NAD(P)H-flavin reductase n=1 Tax=Microbulbifer yueqingensis TaxID=658219 RepID=A0A1G8ZV32_9GAMM|nr:FAD/NAD(P)-binding protein [Microbulbifer yueqingensis]SDK18225.1 NAD(P)H-flavin reductase [Microbulbifer yueqingensis]
MIPAVYRIERRIEEMPGTFTLSLLPGAREEVVSLRPGQFNMLYAFGAGEVPISSSGTADTPGLVHTIRAQGAVTRALERLREGDTLGLRGPFGNGWPVARLAGRELLVIAGGLGLAPLRPIIYAQLQGSMNVHSVRLFYGARRPAEVLYRSELEQWGRALEVVATVDHADVNWPGRVGVITAPLSTAQLDPQHTVAFICGPEIMMRFCVQLLMGKGISPANIYLSMERNMKCATGHCGHCQWGPNFICRDGPVFRYSDIRGWWQIPAL